jgi:hypothetical protein
VVKLSLPPQATGWGSWYADATILVVLIEDRDFAYARGKTVGGAGKTVRKTPETVDGTVEVPP